jgi:hypothetical protein
MMPVSYLPKDTPPKIIKMAQSEKDLTTDRAFYRIIRSIMIQVCKKINADPNMSKLLLPLLGPTFITVQTNAKFDEKNQKMTISFNAIPATQPGAKIEFKPGTTYRPDAITTRLQFSITK